MMLRPMRPNPLIPTLMAICNSSSRDRSTSGCVETADSNERLARWSNRGLQCTRIRATCTSLYSVLIVAFFVVMSPYLLYQAVRYRKYIGSLPQRLGYLPVSFNLDGDESIWIHAVSVGEVLTARALLPELRERYPRLRIFLSTTTMTGQQIARNNLQYVDEVFYFPFDLGFIVNRTLRLVRPRLFIMMETEIWPNLLRACRARRASRRCSSTAGSRRARIRATGWRGRSSAACSPTSIASACRATSRRGASSTSAPIPTRVIVTGSLKFDSLEMPGDASTAADRGRNRVLRYFRIAPDRPVVIAASTLKGEEDAGARGLPAHPRDACRTRC